MQAILLGQIRQQNITAHQTAKGSALRRFFVSSLFSVAFLLFKCRIICQFHHLSIAQLAHYSVNRQKNLVFVTYNAKINCLLQ